MSDCIFCKIVNGEIPCYKVWEDENVLAFLDANPAVDGHTLVIPKEHDQDIFTSADEILKNIGVAFKKVGNLLKNNFGADGVNIVNNSGKDAQQEVNHIHFHILPRFKDDGRDLKFVGGENIGDNFEEIAKKIRGEENA